MKRFMTPIKQNRSIHKLLFHISLVISMLVLNQGNTFANNTKECESCFHSEVNEPVIEGNHVTFNFTVKAGDSCNYALSHFTVSVPHGTITNASNSGGWKMEYPVTDPTTGLSGIKVDDIENFGETGEDSFTLSYRVYVNDSATIDSLVTQGFEVAYKAATCVFYEEIPPSVSQLEATLTPTRLTCADSADGKLTSTVTGGQPPYDYLWSNGATSPGIDNLEAGNYTLTITDASGASISLSAEVQSPSPIVYQKIVKPSRCAEDNGAIDLTVSGGTAPYSFEWSNGSTDEDISDVPSGAYTVLITDSTGCSKQASFNVSEYNLINIRTSSTKLKCHETNTGTIALEVTGGVEPYSYEWSTGDTTKNLANLEAGQYSVTVTDAEGCTKTKNASISNELFHGTFSSTDATCQGADGSATLTLQNGTEPYSINWSSGDTTLTAENLETGYHTVRVTDANGCQLFQAVNIKGYDIPQISTTSRWTGCSDNDSIQVNLSASGGTEPFEWRVNGSETSTVFYLHDEGEQEITVTDANGCSATEIINIDAGSADPAIQLEVTDATCSNQFGAASVSIEGEGPFGISWNGTEGTRHVDSLAAGNHTIRVVDVNGCESSDSFSINEVLLPRAEIIMPGAMPDCDTDNNMLEVSTSHVQDFNWQLNSTDENWIITSENQQSMTYNAGAGSALAIFTAESTDGCITADSLLLECIDNTVIPPDTTDDDTITEKECSTGCYEIESEAVTYLSEEYYSYEITVTTDGSCWYDLSHLIIEIEDGVAANVHNSMGFPMEINSTDPRSGIHGIKIDEISGFEAPGNQQIIIRFDIRGAENPESEFNLAFKAGPCLDIVTHQISSSSTSSNLINTKGETYLKVYPNPTPSEVTFEFSVPLSVEVSILLYDMSGKPFQQVFNKHAKEGVTYKISTNIHETSERIIFYRMQAGEKIIEGKILKLQ